MVSSTNTVDCFATKFAKFSAPAEKNFAVAIQFTCHSEYVKPILTANFDRVASGTHIALLGSGIVSDF